MLNTKKASIFIYVIILVGLSLLMAGVVLNSIKTLSLTHEIQKTHNVFENIIQEESKHVFDGARVLNSNGTGFIDNISCPQNFSMSGSVHSGTIDTTLYMDESITYCSGTYQSNSLIINFNGDYTDFVSATYNGDNQLLHTVGVGKKGASTFPTDATLIDFSSYNYTIPNTDDIDDNKNSDNYRLTSTGGIYYPNNYHDDDHLHRITKVGYIQPLSGRKSILWSNSASNKIIDDNTNNSDTVYKKIGDSNNGLLHLDVQGDYILSVYEFDKTIFGNDKELKIIGGVLDSNLSSGSGFLQDTSSGLTLSGSITGSEYVFDFKDKDYGVVIDNVSSTEFVSYKITGYDSVSGSGLYLVPIDDSKTQMRYLANILIDDDDGGFMYKQKEVFSPK